MDATVKLWGREIGAVSWIEERALGVFQYAPEFVPSDIQVSPLMMPLRHDPFEFPELSRKVFHGLPGLVADSLPDRFGNAVINSWLARQGRTPESFNPVERLCYIGKRGMGALEFEPAIKQDSSKPQRMEIDALVELANQVTQERESLQGHLTTTSEADGNPLEDILKVGTSAGGARAKAILAWNPKTDEFRSGQIEASSGFEPWLIKFDGIHANKDRELSDPLGFGRVEYAYHLMATAAGIKMNACRLHHENGRSHFMTRRFDRTDAGKKIHMQTLGALAHFDFDQAGAYAYEQVLQIMRTLNLPFEDIEQQFLRAIFNVMARNQDDHVKNIAFLMNPAGEWRLSPAYDVTYSWNPGGYWTSVHQMTLNGKRDQFELKDLYELAEHAGLKKGLATQLIEQCQMAIRSWSKFADQAGIEPPRMEQIQRAFRLKLQ